MKSGDCACVCVHVCVYMGVQSANKKINRSEAPGNS